MRKKQRDPSEAGTILKHLAPVLGMTLEQLAGFFADNKPPLQDYLFRHYFMGETPWPFEELGYDDCLKIVCNFLNEQQHEGKLTEQDMEKKQEEVKRILAVAFFDIDRLSFFGRKAWDIERNEIWNNSKVGLIEPPIPYIYQQESNNTAEDESNDTTEDPIENEIEWIMRDISNLDIETLCVLNRYFDAFSSITETDLKWIDWLDCLGHVEGFGTLDEFKSNQLKVEYSVGCGLILENMNSKDFRQWLELFGRRGYKDSARKKKSSDVDKLKADIEKNIRTYTNNHGFTIISLHNFIRYLVEKHNGSFFNIERKFWETFLLIKYWISHFKNVPEQTINIYSCQ